jgi:hypothetical protein
VKRELEMWEQERGVGGGGGADSDHREMELDKVKEELEMWEKEVSVQDAVVHVLVEGDEEDEDDDLLESDYPTAHRVSVEGGTRSSSSGSQVIHCVYLERRSNPDNPSPLGEVRIHHSPFTVHRSPFTIPFTIHHSIYYSPFHLPFHLPFRCAVSGHSGPS